jgi:hypothetical protein
MVQAVVAGKVAVRFADPQAEAKRRELSNTFNKTPNKQHRTEYERT